MNTLSRFSVAFSLTLTLLMPSTSALAQKSEISNASDRFIVIWDKGTTKTKISNLSTKSTSFEKVRKLEQLDRIDIFKRPEELTLKEAMLEAQKLPGVMHVEPDYRVYASNTTPNDADFFRLWGLDNNTNDINGPEAWDLTTGGSNAVVAVIDTGVNYNHVDLAANMWTNPGEVAGNGIDDDGNGWIDDVYGIDTVNGDADPMDDQGHGTHVAGTIGAVGNNAIGISGVAWQTQIIACKFLDQSGSGYTSAAITCLDYLLDLKVNHGVNLVATNNSWGGGGFSQALKDAIINHQVNDILFVAAAGNSGQDTDLAPSYPASYEVTNIISVGALSEDGNRAGFSNYGASSVDLFAPGTNIYSTYFDGSYASLSGTSMAAPHVTGAIALLHELYPSKTASDYKNLLLVGGKALGSLDGLAISSATLQLWGSGNTGSLNCVNRQFSKRLSPVDDNISVAKNSAFSLQVSLLNCDTQTSQIIASVGGQNLVLQDDGLLGDQVAGDGILSRDITVDWNGTQVISFPDTSLSSFQVTATTPPEVREVSYFYTDIVGTPLNLSDDQSVQIPIDFMPMAPSGSFNEVWVNSNGTISTSFYSSYGNSSLPAFVDKHMAYAWWDDLYPGASGNQYWEVRGSAPNRQLIIEWRDITRCCSFSSGDSYTVTFQAILYESEPKIRFNYKDASASSLSNFHLGLGATVGYENNGNGTQFSYNQASLSDSMSLEIVPNDFSEPDVTITLFETEGLARPGSLQTVTLIASDKNNLPVTKEVDLDDGNGFVPVEGNTITVRYPNAGNYLLTARASNGTDQTNSLLAVDIQSYSSDELALINEIRTESDRYGLIDASALGASPESFGYISISDLVQFNPDVVSDAPVGLHLWATSNSINDLGLYFSTARYVWIYENDVFKGWSPDALKRQQIINSGYELITTIPAGAGVWVSK